jgi:hypothetical protein
LFFASYSFERYSKQAEEEQTKAICFTLQQELGTLKLHTYTNQGQHRDVAHKQQLSQQTIFD